MSLIYTHRIKGANTEKRPDIYCADVCALYRPDGQPVEADDHLVLIERLSSVPGFALPGGKRERKDGEKLVFGTPEATLEDPALTAVREFGEETNLELVIEGIIGRYEEPGRDPRGWYVADALYGRANGIIRSEPGKTRVFTVPLPQVREYIPQMLFDHGRVIEDFLQITGREQYL